MAWSINAHMVAGTTELSKAKAEHEFFVETLRNAGAEVIELPFLHGAYDSVFTKDNAVVASAGGHSRVLLGKPATLERKIEQKRRRKSFLSQGFEISGVTERNLEGGDVVISPCYDVAFLGYGFRSSRGAAQQLQEFLGFRVVKLHLVDPYFYHLDTALSLTCDGDRTVAFALKEAFTPESWAKLCNDKDIHEVVEVSREEAMAFGLNWVEVNGTIVIGSYTPNIISELQRLGKEVEVAPLSQFQLAGGSAACLTARVHEIPDRSRLAETRAPNRYSGLYSDQYTDLYS